MREIKFRAWDELKKEMVYWDFLYTQQVKDFASGKGPWAVNKLMQFTGLKDKNGKEIYEGDIAILTDGSDKVTSQIEWYNPICGFALRGLTVRLPKLVNEYDSFEVIGNIYENPDLLTNK